MVLIPWNFKDHGPIKVLTPRSPTWPAFLAISIAPIRSFLHNVMKSSENISGYFKIPDPLYKRGSETNFVCIYFIWILKRGVYRIVLSVVF